MAEVAATCACIEDAVAVAATSSICLKSSVVVANLAVGRQSSRTSGTGFVAGNAVASCAHEVSEVASTGAIALERSVRFAGGALNAGTGGARVAAAHGHAVSSGGHRESGVASAGVVALDGSVALAAGAAVGERR